MKEKLVEIYLNNSLIINISVISLLILFMMASPVLFVMEVYKYIKRKKK